MALKAENYKYDLVLVLLVVILSLTLFVTNMNKYLKEKQENPTVEIPQQILNQPPTGMLTGGIVRTAVNVINTTP